MQDKETQPNTVAGKAIVIVMVLSMIVAYFALHSQGRLLSARVLVPMALVTAVSLAAMFGVMTLATKLEARPQTRKLITAFFITLFVGTALVVFRLSGIGV